MLVKTLMSRAICGIAAMLLFAGCTPTENKSSRMSVSIPPMMKASNSAQSLQLGHLVINVTGSGISNTILYVWEGCKDNSGCTSATIPSSFSIENIPTGKSRLIQVLAVYEDSTTQSGQFFYGDVTADLAKLDESVKIPVADITGGVPLVSGNISGRYMDTVDSGPTGPVDIKYQPPGDRPALILEKSKIANGWMSLFGLRGIPLRYIVSTTGRDIFGRAVDLSDRTLFMPSQKVVKIFKPITSYMENSVLQNDLETETNIIGFFGPGASAAKAVCRAFAGGDLADYKYVYGSSTQKLDFTVIANSAAEPTLNNTSSPPSGYVIQGGIAMTTGDCVGYAGTAPNTANNLYQNFLPLTKDNVKNGRDDIAGFRFPFGMVNTPAGTSGLSPSSFQFGLVDSPTPMVFKLTPNVSVGGKVLPGISSLINGLRFYKIPAAAGASFEHQDQFSCGAIGAVGTSIGTTNIMSGGEYYAQTSMTATDITSGFHFAACFDGINGPLDDGIFISNSRLNGGGAGGGGGGGSTGPYLRLEGLYDYQQNGMTIRHLTRTQCYETHLATYSNNGNPYTRTATLNVQLTNGNFSFHGTNAECESDSNPIPSTVMPANGDSVQLFMRPRGGASSAPLGISTTGSTILFNSDGNFMISSPILKFGLPATALGSISSGACYPFEVMAMEADGVTPFIRITVPRSFTVTLPGTGTVGSICGSGGGIVPTIAAGNYKTATAFFQPGSSGTFSFNSAPSSDYVIESLSFNVQPTSATATTLMVALDTSIPEIGKCVHGTITLRNAAGNLVPATTNVNVLLTNINGGGTYSDVNCGMPARDFILAQNSFKVDFWYKAVGLGGVSINAVSTQYQSGSVSITNQIPSASGPYLSVTMPNAALRNATLMASHDLASNTYLPMSFTKVGTVQSCRKDGSPDCMSQIDVGGGLINFVPNDIADNVRFTIRMSSGTIMRDISFFPKDILNPILEFVTCDQVITANATNPTLAGGTTCLAPDVVLTMTSQIDLNTKRVVGSIYKAGAGNKITSSYAGPALVLNDATAGGVLLANLELSRTAGYNILQLSSSGTTTNAVKIRSVIFKVNAGATTTAVYVAGGDYPLNFTDVVVDATVNGKGLSISGKGGSTVIEGMTIYSTNASFRGVELISTSAVPTGLAAMEDFIFSGAGHAISLYGDGATPVAAHVFNGRRISLTNSDGAGFDLHGPVTLDIDGLKSSTTGGMYSAIMIATGDSINQILNLTNARFLNNVANVPFINVADPSAGVPSVVVTLKNTHFKTLATLTDFFFVHANHPGITMTATPGNDPSTLVCRASGVTAAGLNSGTLTVTNLSNVSSGGIFDAVVGGIACTP